MEAPVQELMSSHWACSGFCSFGLRVQVWKTSQQYCLCATPPVVRHEMPLSSPCAWWRSRDVGMLKWGFCYRWVNVELRMNAGYDSAGGDVRWHVRAELWIIRSPVNACSPTSVSTSFHSADCLEFELLFFPWSIGFIYKIKGLGARDAPLGHCCIEQMMCESNTLARKLVKTGHWEGCFFKRKFN